MEKFEFIEWDKRILDQRLRKHEMSQQEFQKYLKGLPDEKEKGEELAVGREEERRPGPVHSG